MSPKLMAFIWFVWVILIFLGSTFEYRDNPVLTGQDYSVGNATFVQGSTTVIGGGTVWVANMAGGLIKHNTDDQYCKILTVVNNTELTLVFGYPEVVAGGAAAPYTMTASKSWAGAGEQNTVAYLLNFKNATNALEILGVVSIPMPNKQYFVEWFHVITLNFDFLQGVGYQMFYWIVLVPIVVMGVVAMVLLFLSLLRGNIPFV